MKVRLFREPFGYLIVAPPGQYNTDVPDELVTQWMKIKRRLNDIEQDILEHINEHDPNYLDTNL